MSISPLGSLSSSSALGQLEALYRKMEAKSEASAASTAGTTSTTSSDSDSISGIGKLLSNLQDLAATNPSKFKQETAQIAAQLNTAASNTSGDESTFLKDLSSQFQQASDTGDASALTAKHHGHRHGGGTSNTSGQSGQANAYNNASLFSLLDSSSPAANSDAANNRQSLLTGLLGSDTN